MAYSRPAGVRSHRRRGRRRGIAPWLVVALVAVLVGAGVTAGYVRLIRPACTGTASATIVASPATASILEDLSLQWAKGEPNIDGTCASVQITAKDSAEMAIALQNPWDPKVNGPAPDAWVPQSTAWVRRAAVDSDAERMMPDRQPSIARSPAVLAMPKPMAEKLGWPNQPITWQTVIDNATGRMNWSSHGQPDWGPFKLGMTDPARSTAGLLALTAMLDRNDDEEISAAEMENLFRLNQAIEVRAARTADILNEYARRSAESPEAGLAYISAFPALEQEVLDHNLTNPRAPLVAIYPEQSIIEADHPFLVLEAEWSTDQAKQVAALFRDYVRGHEGGQRLLDAGFRDPNRVPGRDLTVQNGVAPEITAMPRAALLPDSVTRTITTWTGLNRASNVLLVLDVSGSMADVVPGAGGTRMDLAKRAAREALALFSDDDRVGLWVFSTGQRGSTDYREVVSLGPLGDVVNGQTRKARLTSGINGLRAVGGTGLYDTVAAAQKFMLDKYQPDAVNLVVVMTDGKNEDSTGGLSYEQLLQQLEQNNADPARRVPVTTVGFGTAADYPTLQEIARVTGGLAFESRESFDITQVLITAIFHDL